MTVVIPFKCDNRDWRYHPRKDHTFCWWKRDYENEDEDALKEHRETDSILRNDHSKYHYLL